MTLTEKIEDLNEKERIVLLATQPGAITLATPNFGRGTDFICRNKEVEANGGLHVILTFMCTQKSEFV
jgi:preprotein translocase subunit SecA